MSVVSLSRDGKAPVKVKKKRTLIWHIGPDDLGSAWLAQALHGARDELAEQGVQVAGTPAAWELATAELRRNHRDRGFKRAEVEGQCAWIARRVWKHKGVSILSTPGLAAATADQIALALDGFRGVRVHLVFVVRNLTDQAYAAAQAALVEGGHPKPVRFATQALGEPSHKNAVAFRAGHDVPTMVRAWTQRMKGIAGVHVIASDDPSVVWSELGAVGGFDVPLPPVEPTQLTKTGLSMLTEAVQDLGDMAPRARRAMVGRWLSEQVLPRFWGGFTELSAAAGYMATWPAELQAAGVEVRGDFNASMSAPLVGIDESPGEVLGEIVAEVARLRAENTRLSDELEREVRKGRKYKRRLAKLIERDGDAA